jgi:hypothetical protein
MPEDEIENFILRHGRKLDVRHKEKQLALECHGVERSYRHLCYRQAQDQVATQERGFENGHDMGRGFRWIESRFDRQAMRGSRPACIDDPGLGNDAVWNDSSVVGFGQDLGGAPVRFDHPPFQATLQDDPVARMIGFGEVQHHAGKQIA